jgi:hypothetical protein
MHDSWIAAITIYKYKGVTQPELSIVPKAKYKKVLIGFSTVGNMHIQQKGLHTICLAKKGLIHGLVGSWALASELKEPDKS